MGKMTREMALEEMRRQERRTNILGEPVVPEKPRFRLNDYVSHPDFGNGFVTAIRESEDGRIENTVYFGAQPAREGQVNGTRQVFQSELTLFGHRRTLVSTIDPAILHGDNRDENPTVGTLKVTNGQPPRGRYMHTAGGTKYYPLDPHPSEVSVETIAHHLATKGRWNGATQHKRFRDRIMFSVAEHAVYVALFLAILGKSREIVRQGLHHDDSEAYNGDLIRPLKYAEEFAAPFKKVEEKNEAAIAAAFGFAYPYHPDVKMADEAVCAAESQQIVVRLPTEEWESGKLHDDSLVAPFEIAMLTPYLAKGLYLDLHERIENDRIPRTIAEIAEFLKKWGAA